MITLYTRCNRLGGARVCIRQIINQREYSCSNYNVSECTVNIYALCMPTSSAHPRVKLLRRGEVLRLIFQRHLHTALNFSVICPPSNLSVWFTAPGCVAFEKQSFSVTGHIRGTWNAIIKLLYAIVTFIVLFKNRMNTHMAKKQIGRIETAFHR